MLCMRLLLAALWAEGARQAVQTRPPLPFNDPDFVPTHPTPVVYLHGITASVRSFRQNAELLRSRGYWVWGHDYGDMFAPGLRGVGEVDLLVDDVAEIVDRVLRATGAAKVDLVVHSQGGLMAKLYIASGGAERVRRVVAMGANFHGTDLAGYARWFEPVIAKYPRFASFVAPGGVQQLVSSEWNAAHVDVPDTDPRVVYTSLYSPADRIVTPNSASRLIAVDGADVANIDVAEWYDGYAPRHPMMPRDPLLAELTAWGLERAPGETRPPAVEWLA